MPVTTLDFDAVSYGASVDGFGYHSGSILEDGFTVSNLLNNGSQAFGTLRRSDGYNRHDMADNVPYATFQNGAGQSQIRIVKDNAESWDATSIQLDMLATGASGSVILQALKSDGVTLVQTVVGLDAILSLQTFALDPTFRDIIRLDVVGPTNFQFNDVMIRTYTQGTAAADVFVISSPSAAIKGFGGNDTFTFSGTTFDNGQIIDGGAGSDIIVLQNGYSMVLGGSVQNITNVETLRLLSGTYNLILADLFVSSGQTLDVDGTFLNASQTMIVDGSAETNGILNLYGGAAGDNLTGGSGNDYIGGGGGGDILNGGGGNDVLVGGTGADIMFGGGGNDQFYVDNASDIALESGGGGSDQVLASVDYVLFPGQSIEILSTDWHAGTAALSLGGNELNNIIYGNAGNNILYGKGGSDWLEGLGGDDQYYVDHAGDYVREVAGGGSDRILASADYTLYAGQEVEILSTDNNAGTAAIALGGNELDNSIYGNDGNNILYGKGGNDTLLGLGGNDQFWFNTAPGPGNVDIIYGFVSGSDKVVLFNSAFTGLSAGNLSASAFVTGSAAGDTDDRIIYNSATGALLFDADGSGAGGAVQFATLNGAPALAASDFIVF